MPETEAEQGEVRIVAPGEGDNYWQPVPANGHISVRVAPHLVAMMSPFALGTQTVPPGCYVREHLHPHHDEVLHFISGKGKAVIEGTEHRLEPGTTVFIGRNRRHMFINDGAGDMHWLWFIQPNGLEDFFRDVGRPKSPGEPAPEPFARPADVAEIERRTAFAPLPGGGRKPA
ncbi:MAG TPA: cupin domain-containing protein [Pseudorhodoplanes sp.]|jgi:mannose-6-phosphate isomerase-like protein (cupin superfamily)|nr:cupin domain-containing protein [Pseudorhodoplanes sp.]